MMKKPVRTPFFSLLLLSCALFTACAAGPRPAGQSLYPYPASMEGYSVSGRDNIFEDENVRISIRQVRKAEAGAGPFIEGLLEKDYAVFNLSIENRSNQSVMYNPAYTVLTSDSLDYRKPLDFTDLYDITDDHTVLASLKGRFYDLNATVAPGSKTSRLLIFRPLSEEAARAEVTIKEIYIGTSTQRLAFPFVFKDGE